MINTVSSLVSDEQKQQYQEVGFCVVDGLFTETELTEIEKFFEDYKEQGGAVFDGGARYEEIDKTARQVRAMQPHRYSTKAREWLLNPNVVSVLEELLGCPPLAAQTMYYYKPPGAKGQGMHQDDFYLLTKPATCIAAWTAIDSADEDNGCLWVVPHSNKYGIQCPEKGAERWLSYGDSHITKFPRDNKPIAVPVPRGSTMFFGGHLIHGSGPNRTTDRFRRTFIGHYIDEASEQVSKYYHPVLDRSGNAVSHVAVAAGGGPCGDDWRGAAH